MFEATIKMPGTCGELVQGTMDGVSFHISCPINIFSSVKVELSYEWSGLTFPASCPKAGMAMQRMLEQLGRTDLGGSLTISTSLPRGKGMASSTADIAATIHATSAALGERVTSEQAAQIALTIEPTDGSLFPGVVLFDHRHGQVYRYIGSPPPIDIVILDFGGEVDTIAFNKCDRRELLQGLEQQTAEARDMVIAGLTSSDPLLTGQGATLSARANQKVLFKPYLEQVIAVTRETNALGVNVAHSGTVIGVLVDARTQDATEVLSFLSKRLPVLEAAYLCSLIGGGAAGAEFLEKPTASRLG